MPTDEQQTVAQQAPTATRMQMLDHLESLKTDPAVLTNLRAAAHAARFTAAEPLPAAGVKVLLGAAPVAQQAAAEPNNDEVICPACCHQFRAIPVNVQRLLLSSGHEPPFMAAHAQQPAQALTGEQRERLVREVLGPGAHTVDLNRATLVVIATERAHGIPAPTTGEG